MVAVTQKIRLAYKQTEIGSIPQDWDVVLICEITNEVGDGIHSTPIYSNDGEYYFVNGNNLFNGRIIITQDTKTSEYSEYKKHNKPLSNRTILLSINGTIGNLALYSGEPVILGKSAAYLNVKKDFSRQFVYFSLQTESVRKYFDDGLTGTTIKNLGLGIIRKTPIRLPKKKNEQIAIAAVLSDMDTLIEELEKLIAKKQSIKQGTMQELLTGKRRLSGFSGEWVRKKLGQVGDITGSGIDKKIKPDEVSVRLVNFLDVFNRNYIYSKDLNFYSSAKPEQLSRCSVKRGDIFFTPSSEMPFDIGISSVAMEDIADAAYSYHVTRFRLWEDWDLLFRAYAFKTKNFSDQTEKFCEGSGKRYVLNLTAFRKRLSVYYPTDKREQVAIANVLSDMDAEIERLKLQLAKYRFLKQGMMQVLLTGKVRLA